MGDKKRAKAYDQKILAELEKHQRDVAGDFPKGKVHSDDKGTVAMAIGRDDEKKVVFLQFAYEVSWLAMEPEYARQMAALLVAHANKLEGI